ncbi:MAG: TlpA disulfide reductase family protein [Gammaproteobacteria bacterium]|nr:TlpA disulfide reductase family protein [Gammaproteobacteria bacterium]
MTIKTILILPFIFMHTQAAFSNDNTATQNFELNLTGEATISITRFGDHGDRILWIPSERGVSMAKHSNLLNALAKQQHEIWLADLHQSYFIPAGRSSYTRIPVSDIAELIEKSLPDDNRKLFIVTTGRGAVLSLLALNYLQNKAALDEQFGGIIMLHPNFQAETPTPGIVMEYLPIVDITQLPIFIIQPEKSNKFWYLDKLIQRLSDAGSKVYSQTIDQVSDGYHVRPDNNEIENQKAKELPGQISHAIKLLAQTKIDARKKITATSKPWAINPLSDTLQPYPGNPAAPALRLKDTDDKLYDLDEFHGKVVVLNFWGTWCTPCVKEIPSLGRLQKSFSKNDLAVLSVTTGESKKEINDFLKKIPADFPVLLNPDGSTVKQWKIVAFPTTFIIDQQGNIQLAYFGGLEWDEPGVIDQLQKMVSSLLKP